MVRPTRINGRAGATLVVALILNTARLTDMAGNEVEATSSVAVTESDLHPPKRSEEAYLRHCPPSDRPCSELPNPCVKCTGPIDCIYGEEAELTCEVMKKVQCSGSTNFLRRGMCRYCYQTEKWEHQCVERASCNSVASPLKYYVSNCTARADIVCLGNRDFPKKVRCAWSGGTRWGTAVVLALTLGGFGADRFYLGHWQEGIGKLFSFGGLGVWTLVDALLIGVHHLGPADGSLYL